MSETIRVLHLDDDPFQTGITRDITTRKQRERRFETLTDNLPGMVYRCRNEPGWPMEDVCGDVAAFTGHTAAELETGEVEWGNDVVHPDDREWVWTEVQSSLAPGESCELTYRTVTDDGETRWVWERGRGVYGPENELDAIEGSSPTSRTANGANAGSNGSTSASTGSGASSHTTSGARYRRSGDGYSWPAKRGTSSTSRTR
jgi:PAS domain-containing protein